MSHSVAVCVSNLPAEILRVILIHVDPRTLAGCVPLVCRQWNFITTTCDFWAEKCSQLAVPVPRLISGYDHDYRRICLKRPYARNLIKNPSGEERLSYWQFTGLGMCNNACLRVEPAAVDDVNEDFPICFASSCRPCYRVQTVDLIAEGCDPVVLDELAPTISCSEWHAHRTDCPSRYTLRCSLLNQSRVAMQTKEVVCDEIRSKAKKWENEILEFSDYPAGVRFVTFESIGTDLQFWIGNYGPKMAKASDGSRLETYRLQQEMYSRLPGLRYTLPAGEKTPVLQSSDVNMPNKFAEELRTFLSVASD